MGDQRAVGRLRRRSHGGGGPGRGDDRVMGRGRAGLEHVSPHDLSTAQKIAGHAEPKTTARYDQRGERAKQAAAAKMTVDYAGMR